MSKIGEIVKQTGKDVKLFVKSHSYLYLFILALAIVGVIVLSVFAGLYLEKDDVLPGMGCVFSAFILSVAILWKVTEEDIDVKKVYPHK